MTQHTPLSSDNHTHDHDAHDTHSHTDHADDNHNDHNHHDHSGAHGHMHGIIDPGLATTERGIWAIKWSFAGLLVTALLQVVIVYYSGSVALLSDTIHNLGDATTAIPLWIAFALARRRPSPRFTYGYGKVEDLAGVVIVLIILLSAVTAGYEALQRLWHPQPVAYLGAVVAASIIGFLGNELVALFRLRVGKEINSAALVADGYHARVDGLTSLAVLVSAVGVWLGYPLADPVIGLLIALAILRIVWDASQAVFVRLLDGIDPTVVDELRHIVSHVAGVRAVSDVRGRWAGHRLQVELNLAVAPELSVAESHTIAMAVRHRLLHQLPYLAHVTIHTDPEDNSGEAYHQISEHTHEDLPVHAHP